MINYDDFKKVQIKVGRILGVEKLPNPKYTTHKLTIDLGEEIGTKVSGARVINYTDAELVGDKFYV
jgi:tRNA-binding protein